MVGACRWLPSLLHKPQFIIHRSPAGLPRSVVESPPRSRAPGFGQGRSQAMEHAPWMVTSHFDAPGPCVPVILLAWTRGNKTTENLMQKGASFDGGEPTW